MMKSGLSTILAVVLTSLLLYQYPITAKAEKEADTTSGACVPRECVYTEWTLWTECSHECGNNGTRNRTRSVLRDDGCRGTCKKAVKESEACNIRCCPQNCVYSSWNHWAYCICSEDECEKVGNRYVCLRSRQKVRQESCGGYCDNIIVQEKCGNPCCYRDCVLGPWAPWTECQAPCEQPGVKYRNRTITQKPRCGGRRCQMEGERQEYTGACCPVDCVLGTWSSWSAHCPTSCGTPTLTPTRLILAQGPPLIFCMRKPRCGGRRCQMEGERQDCTGACCPVNCVLGTWSSWSAHCPTSCGRAALTRTRFVQKAECGGRQCPGDTTGEERKECENYMNVDCKETDTCHKPCQQLCNQAVCSCRPGYVLHSDKLTCVRRTCSTTPLGPQYCGPGTVPFKSCLYVKFACPPSTEFESRCNATCSGRRVVKGGQPFITCQANGRWNSPKIFCGPRNKAPVNISVNTQEVSELLEADQCFAELTTTTDDEPWDKHTYAIIKDGSSNLQIRDDHICCIKPFDFERTGLRSWQTTVRSTDLDGLLVDREFTFSLLNENDPPRSVSLSPSAVRENSPKGTVVGCLEAKDDDPGQSFAFFIVKSMGKIFELFQDPRNKTCVRVSKESDPRCYKEGGSWCHLNYENIKVHYIAIMVKDNGVPPLSSYFDVRISIEDVNEPITDITLEPPAVPESVPPGEPLVQLKAKDEDMGQKHTFRIVADGSGLFSTDGGQLMASKTLDFEEDPNRQFVITLEVSDDGQPPMKTQKEIAFRVGDKNESPYKLLVTGTMMGTVSVYDPDAGDTITFTVSHPKFGLQNKRCAPLKDNVYNYCSAQLVCTEGVDFEMTPTISLTIRAEDKSFHSVHKNLTVKVLDQNDPPTDVEVNGKNSSEIEVKENQRNSRVGDIRVVDEDQGDTHTIFLSGSAASHFRVDRGQLLTTAVSSLDYERQESSPLLLVMTAIDGGRPGQTVMKTFTIALRDVNEAPTAVTLSKTEVMENSPGGTVIGTLTTLDPDNLLTTHQNLTYRLKDDANGRFRVDGDRLLVTEMAENCFSARCSLNHEIQPQLTIKIEAKDSGSPPLSVVAPVIISVKNANDAPTNIRLSKNTVGENRPAGMLVGSIMADDEDVQDSVTFTLLNGSDVFSIEKGDKLVTQRTLNYEETQSVVIAIRASDNGRPPASTVGVITVVVEDEPEPPVYQTPGEMGAMENEPTGSVVGAVLVTDPDRADRLDIVLHEPTHSFVLGKPVCNNSDFGVTCNVTLMTSAVLEFETVNKYTLDVMTRDGQGHTVVKVIKINVKDTNDPPKDVLVEGMAVKEMRVREGREGEEWRLGVVEEDAGQRHTLSILSQRGDHLTLQGNVLRVAKAYDHDRGGEEELCSPEGRGFGESSPGHAEDCRHHCGE
ncbi:hypothetical protein ACOMHN_054609 [Nucella lapillus]